MIQRLRRKLMRGINGSASNPPTAGIIARLLAPGKPEAPYGCASLLRRIQNHNIFYFVVRRINLVVDFYVPRSLRHGVADERCLFVVRI